MIWRGRKQHVEESVIRVLTGMPAGVVGIEPAGKLSADDYTDVLAPALAVAWAAAREQR
jgi:hypothetical protein